MRTVRGTFRALLAAIMLLAILPIAVAATSGVITTPSVIFLSIANILGWSLVATALIARRDLHEALEKLATRSGIPARQRGFLQLFYGIIKDLDRKNQALSVDLGGNRIASKEELSQALEKVVGTAFKLLDAESAELALFDKESGTYHSSFVLGKPFSSNSQAMLSGVFEQESGTAPDIMIEPISFAGTILGSLRVAQKRGHQPSQSDQELLKVLALQGTLAIVNSRYNEELLKMKRSSEESVRAKTGFLANLSHELRGPLGIMLNAVEIVLDGLCGEVTADQVDTLKMVRQNGQHLLELINDVLDYAKSESGKITPDRSQIVVNDLLIDVSNVIRSQAQQKGHKLICRPSDAALAILCDRRHIRQIMINLLTNAIKYTPSGGTIEVWGERAPGNKIKISVKDSGVGIDKEQRHKVFAAFERVDNAYSIKQAGTGLGMPLTKRLAEVNGGSVDFDSEPGKGSQFWIQFPAVEYAPQLVDEPVKTGSITAGAGERILIADSDEEERPMVGRYLEHLGYAVVQTSTTGDALEALKAQSFNLLIVGNELIDDAQERFMQDVRSLPGKSSLPVVLVSSRAFTFDVENYLKIGVDRCLSKPLELKELARLVREVIASRDAQKEGGTGSIIKKGRTSSVKSDDFLH